jgi:hypothetical protein
MIFCTFTSLIYFMFRYSNILFAFCLLLCKAYIGFGQTNLVPNFGFNSNSNCPFTEDQAEFCVGWSKYSESMTTPDYYNSCVADNNYVDVPQNPNFYQEDTRGCGAYMGLVTWQQAMSNYREHIGIQLSEPLIIGQKYFLSFYTVMALIDDATSPSNNIGMKLSTVAYSGSNPAPIDNFAHLRATSIISDTVNWTRISGSIIADSAYNYLMLGNFYDYMNTDTLTQTCGTCFNYLSYYLIDDICISTDSTLCNGGIDLLSCTASLEDNEVNNLLTISPNPFNDVLTLNFENKLNAQLIITDILGKSIIQLEIINKKDIIIDLSHLPSGLFELKVINDSTKQITNKKIVKL